VKQTQSSRRESDPLLYTVVELRDAQIVNGYDRHAPVIAAARRHITATCTLSHCCCRVIQHAATTGLNSCTEH